MRVRGFRCSFTWSSNRARLLGFTGRIRTGRDHLDEVVPAPGDRVGTGVDAHAEGAARQLVDGSPGSTSTGPGPRHTASLHPHWRHKSCHTSSETIMCVELSLLRGVGRVGIEPTT